MTHYTESELKNLIQVRRPVDTKVLELVNPLFDAGGYAWASAQPILALDRYANILRMNSVFAEWTSSTFEEMEGVCLLDAMGEEDSVRIIVPLLELFETGKPLTQVLRVRQMEGNYNHAEWIGTPLRNEVGEVVALIGVGRDISSTERTERERTILYEIATQINTARELDDILLSVRSAVLEIGEFDRAGVWVVRDGQLFGAWGTDFQGNIISEKGIVFPVPGYVQEMQERIADAKHFGVLDVVDYWDASGNVKHYETPQDLAYVGLVGNGVLVGVVFVDNFLTGRTIPLQQLERILPLCEQCAMAIMHTTLLQESHRRLERHQAMMERQVRLNALASAMTSYTDIDHILEQVHRGLVTIAGFDRAGIWVVNEERTGVEEKWGTDRAGQHYSVRGGYIPIERLSPKGFLQLINKQKEYYYYEDYSGLMELEEDHAMYGVHANAAIGLHVEDELVGIVTVDNLLTDAPITLEDVEALLPFANQAALAIRNAWLVEAQNLTIQREQSMARITEAVHAELDVTVILGMVWDAVTEWGGFDRVSLWLQDEAHGVFREVWGTDDEGKRTPLSGEQFTDEQFLNEIFPCFILRRTEIIWDTDAKDLNDLPPRHPFIDRKFRAAIGLWVEGEIKGMVLLGHQTFTPTYSRAKVESLVVLVQQVAVALHRSNLRREQHYHSLKAERLHEISAATNAGKPLNDILRLIFDAVREVEHVDRVGIYYIDAVEQIIREVWGTDREGQRVPIQIDNSCLYNESWRDFIDTEDQEYKHYADYGAEKNVSQNNNMFGVKEHLCISIRADGELQGFLCLDNLFSQDPFTPQKIRELTVFADQAAVAIRDSNLRLLHERALLRQQYLFDILQAANSGEALKNVLLRVYEAILVCGGFDRVGIFTLDTKRDILRGAWGTDNAGVCTDMSHQMFSIWGALHFAFKGDNSRPYIILEDFTETYGLLPDNMMYGVRYHATVALHIEGEPFGIFCIDNFFRDTPITAEDIERILPFAEQTAILVRNARLLEERQHFAMRQQRLAEMAESMSAYTSLSEILRQVRDAAVDVGGFDRAGVFVYDAERSVLQGAWGTDKEGKPEDISYEVYPFLPEEYSFQNPNRLFVISSEYEDSATLPADHSMAQVTYNAQVALFADDELVGILCVDNLITDRIISEEDVCTLLPFAFQAAVAVRNARLLEARRMDQERQDILNQIGESIRSNINLSVILQQVRDAIVRIGLFDRAGVFIYNPKRQSLQGTWGTNRDGTIEDISHQVFDQFDMKRLLLWDAVVGKERYTITQDYTDALQLAPGHFMYGVQSHARVPMMVGEEVYGLLCVDTLTSQRTITDADVKLLLPFVDQAAIAVRNAWMLEERERDLERQRRLARLAVAVSTNTELNDVLRLAREAIVKGAGFDRAGIYLLDETRTILKGT
jgi:PAS domain S-box-containing protein